MYAAKNLAPHQEFHVRCAKSAQRSYENNQRCGAVPSYYPRNLATVLQSLASPRVQMQYHLTWTIQKVIGKYSRR